MSVNAGICRNKSCTLCSGSHDTGNGCQNLTMTDGMGARTRTIRLGEVLKRSEVCRAEVNKTG